MKTNSSSIDSEHDGRIPEGAGVSSIAPEDKVPVGQKIAYGAGGMTEQLGNALMQQLFMPIFNISMGISPALLGVVLMVYRLFDALADPIVGNLSDNTRTRWGRRRPYIVVGGILTGILFPILWQARGTWGEPVIITFMIVVGLLYYAAFTVWAMPYYSMGMELTPSYNERTRVIAYRMFFNQFTGLISGWLLAVVSLSIFANPLTGEPDMANGMRYVGWGIGFIILAVAVLPGFFVKERYYAKMASKQPKVPLIKSMRETLSCYPFLLIIGIVVIQAMGYGIVFSLGLYLNIYYVHAGDMQQGTVVQGLKSTANFIPGLLSVPLWAWVSERFGKDKAIGATLVLGMIANILIFFCYTPASPYLQIVPHVLMSAFGFGVWMIAPSMQADIVDFDELKTGERREGSFSAVFSWALKLSGTVTAAIGGLIIVWSGFDVKAYGADQPLEVLRTMLYWYAFLPLGFGLLALVLLYLYPLKRERMREIRDELERRRGKV